MSERGFFLFVFRREVFLSHFFAHLRAQHEKGFGVVAVAASDPSPGRRDGGGGGGLGKRQIPAPDSCLGLQEAGACGFHPPAPPRPTLGVRALDLCPLEGGDRSGAAQGTSQPPLSGTCGAD